MPASQTVRDAPEGTWRYHHREEVMGTVVTFDLFCEGDVDREPLYCADGACPGHSAARRRGLQHVERGQPDEPVAQSGDHRRPSPARSGRRAGGVREGAVSLEGWFDPWAMPGGVDPTGYVKGWATQRAIDVLVMPGITSAVVNAAGDIASFGDPVPAGLSGSASSTRATGDAWPVPSRWPERSRHPGPMSAVRTWSTADRATGVPCSFGNRHGARPRPRRRVGDCARRRWTRRPQVPRAGRGLRGLRHRP